MAHAKRRRSGWNTCFSVTSMAVCAVARLKSVVYPVYRSGSWNALCTFRLLFSR